MTDDERPSCDRIRHGPHLGRIDHLYSVVLDEKEFRRAIPRIISPFAIRVNSSTPAPCGLIHKESVTASSNLHEIMVSDPVNPAVGLNDVCLIKLREMAMINAHRGIRGRSVATQSERAVRAAENRRSPRREGYPGQTK